MATPVKQPNGKWKIQIVVDGRRIAKRFDTKREALLWAEEPHEPTTGTITFSELLERYIVEVSPKKKGETWERKRIAALQRRPIARLLLADLKREHFADYINERSQEVKPSTIKRELTIFSHALKMARVWRLMSHEPFKDLDKPPASPHRDRRYSQEEIEQIEFIAGYVEGESVVSRSQQVVVALHVAFETAMRLGEIMQITKESFVDGGKSVMLSATKNGAARKVPLSKRARALFASLPTDGNGFEWDSDSASALFRKIVKKTPIEDLTFHDSRHEGITRLAQKIPNVLDLARITGHKDLKMLMIYYNRDVSDFADDL